jgi:hypothetical protein
MITPIKDIVVPSIPQPRKNRLIIKGKFSVTDVFVISIILICWIILWASNVFEGWITIVVSLFAFIFIAVILVWPLNIFGKDKFYIFAGRWFRYIFSKQLYNTTEESKHNKDKTKNDEKNK